MRLSKNWYERTQERRHQKEVAQDPKKFHISGWLLGGIDVERMKKIVEEKEGEPRNENQIGIP